MEMKWHPRGGRRNICNCLLDWSKVPVDTLVRVRDREDEGWILRYFKGINDKNLRRRYEAWESGEKSKTAKGKYLCWKYCELVEEEEDE